MEASDSREPSYYEIALTNRQVLVAFVLLLVCMVVAFFSGVWIGRGGGARAQAATAAASAGANEPPVAEFKFFSEGTQQGRKSLPTPAPMAGAIGVTGSAAGAATGPAGGPAAPTTTAPSPDRRRDRTLAEDLGARAGAPTTPAPGEENGADEAPAAPPLQPAPAAGATTPTSFGKPAAANADAGKRTPGKGRGAAGKPAPPSTAPTPAPAAGATTAVPATPGPATTTTTSGLFIQVFSSPDGTQAQRIYDKLKKAGYRVVIAHLPKGSQTLHRVRVGPFDGRADAQAKAERIRKDFRLETWVTSTP